MKIALIIFILSCSFLMAGEAEPHQQLRRLYIDLFERLPTGPEVKDGVKNLEKSYEKFVDGMLSSDEFTKTLANKISLHYSPDLSTKRNAAGEVDPKYLKRFLRMKNQVEKTYLRQPDFRAFINDLVSGRGLSSNRGALYFYDDDETLEKLTGRFADRVLGVPLKCAQCHNHREYGDIYQMDFWSLAAFFKDTKIFRMKKLQDVISLRNKTSKELGTRLVSNLMAKDDYTYFKDWSKKEKKGIFIHSGEDFEFRESEKRHTRKVTEDLLAEQILILEEKTYINNLRIQYSEDKGDVVAAAVFGETESPRVRDVPRTYLAKWVISNKNPYLKRAVTNWVANWIFGRGFNMPLTDVYGKRKNEKMLSEYSKFLSSKNYNLKLLVKKMVMSELYRRAPALEPDMQKVNLFTERTFRQVPPQALLNLVRLPQEGQRDAFEAELELQAGIISNFSNDDEECESSFSGSLNQSVYVSFDNSFLNFIAANCKNHAKPNKQLITDTVLKLFNRVPSEKEVEVLSDLLGNKEGEERQKAYADVLWILINSPEMRMY